MQVYTAGSRISDIILLTWDNIRGGRADFTQIKSNTHQDIQLPQAALDIIALYRKEGRGYVFPYLESENTSTKKLRGEALDRVRAKINKQLREIQSMTGIQKHLTSHVARHTFADLARKEGVPVYLISKALGHKSLKQTEAYLASFDTKGVDDMLRRLF